jgi:predicted nucleic acid-binding protein
VTTRVLLDTNVVLDFLPDRAPFADAAAALWQANDDGQIEAYISVITPVNVFYIARKLKGAATARHLVESLLSACRVCAPDRSALLSALALSVKDYEDAVQVVSAQAEILDALITRDPDDYKGVQLPVFSPAGFVEQLAPK